MFQMAAVTVRRTGAPLCGAVVLALAVWLAYATVHTVDGPWGRPGSPGVLTVTRCLTTRGGDGDPPAMTCTGAFTPDHGGIPVPGVRLDLDRVYAWAPGETYRAWLPDSSHAAYLPGHYDWLVRFGFFLFLLGSSLALFGTAGSSRWANRTQVVGGVILMSAIPVPLLIWLISSLR